MNEQPKSTAQQRNQWLHLRLSLAEKQQIQQAFERTTQRKMSEYARKMLLGKPMIASYRNQSMDELMEELIRLRKDLNGVANNFNQVVHKLHTLDHAPQIVQWLKRYEVLRITLFQKMEEMRGMMAQLGKAWLQ